MQIQKPGTPGNDLALPEKSETGRVLRDYEVKQLRQIAQAMTVNAHIAKQLSDDGDGGFEIGGLITTSGLLAAQLGEIVEREVSV